MAENLIKKARTRLVSDLTTDVSNKIYSDVISKLEAVADSENNFYIKALESIEDNPRIFKDYIYFALKEVFNCRELDFLDKSPCESRNFLIAYKKLHIFYNKTLSESDRASIHMTYNEMVSLVFEYLSAEYVDMVDPEKLEDEKNNNINPKKIYKNYNEINELFI